MGRVIVNSLILIKDPQFLILRLVQIVLAVKPYLTAAYTICIATYALRCQFVVTSDGGKSQKPPQAFRHTTDSVTFY